jgi:hypothetical protein
MIQSAAKLCLNREKRIQKPESNRRGGENSDGKIFLRNLVLKGK